MINLQRKTLLFGVVSLLLVATLLALSFTWLPNRELAQMLQGESAVTWPPIRRLLYLLTLINMALVGLPWIAHHWFRQPLQSFAAHVTPPLQPECPPTDESGALSLLNAQGQCAQGAATVITPTDFDLRRIPFAQQSDGLRLLAGGIAHDFNNILTTILSEITLGLWQLPHDSSAAEHLTKAARATERAAELTRQLLAYTGQGALLVEELHLTQFIQDSIELLTTLVPSHVQLEWRLQPQSYLVKIDRGHAQQILVNLVINGAEALPVTGGVVRVEAGELTLYAEDLRAFVRNQMPTPGHYLYLRVSDNGVGMGAAILDRIFDPYYSTKESNSGLGLAAILGIVRHYGGGLQVESREGQGSIFMVLLPAATVRTIEAQQCTGAVLVSAVGSAQVQTAKSHDPAPNDSTYHNQQAKPTVMIIDDEMPIREALHDLLSSEGMHVLLAADGREGVNLYQIHQTAIDLILLDMKMPGMNGAQTLVALRAINSQVKVVFCSGYSEVEALKSIGDQPVVAFLQKPIDINLLLKTIRGAVNG